MVIKCQTLCMLWGSNFKNLCIQGCLKMHILDFAIWLNVKDDNFKVEKEGLIWLDTPFHSIVCGKIFQWNYHQKASLENLCIWHSVFTATLSLLVKKAMFKFFKRWPGYKIMKQNVPVVSFLQSFSIIPKFVAWSFLLATLKKASRSTK